MTLLIAFSVSSGSNVYLAQSDFIDLSGWLSITSTFHCFRNFLIMEICLHPYIALFGSVI